MDFIVCDYVIPQPIAVLADIVCSPWYSLSECLPVNAVMVVTVPWGCSLFWCYIIMGTRLLENIADFCQEVNISSSNLAVTLREFSRRY